MKFKKKLFINLFLLVLTNTIYSQDNNKKLFYTDAFFVTSNENNFEYIKEIEGYETNKETYPVKIYYKSGKIFLTGNTLDKDRLLLHGKCLYFYENGKKKKIANYENNKLIDKQFYYYENGLFKLESEIEVSKNKKEYSIKIHNFFDENNVQKVTNGEGEFVDQQSDNETSFGVIKNFVKEGIWKGSILDKKVEFTEQYIKGKLTAGNSIDSLNNNYSYNIIRETAIPKKGINDFYNYVKNCGVIPKDIDGNVKGKITIIFDVTQKGTLENVSAYSQDQFGVTENAVKLISMYGNWMPSKYRGMLVKEHFILPITFQ